MLCRMAILAAALLLLCPLPSRAIEPDPACGDPVLLGSAGWDELKAMMREQRAAERSGEHSRAIELQRQVARLQCRNHYQQYVLAELLVQAGQMSEAVEVLHGLYARKANDVEIRLKAVGNKLQPLWESPALRSSDLWKDLEGRRTLFEQRRSKSLARLASLPPEQKPASPFVSKNVCPFECCTYRTWTAETRTQLVKAPGSDRVVGVAEKGQRVEALTGEVHLTPTPVVLVAEAEAYEGRRRTLKRGEFVFLLDTMGEGFRHVWHKGEITSMSVSGNVQDYCPFPAKECWGERLAPEEGEPLWWIRIRLPDAIEGWTRQGENFSGMSSCD